MTRKNSLFFLLALALTLAAFSVSAKKLYKYQDETGKWHFSDTPPKTSQPVETEQLTITRQRRKVTVRNRGATAEPTLYIVNEYFGPVEVEIDLIRGNNVTAEPPLPARFTVPPTNEIRAVALRPVYSDRSWSYQYRYRIALGPPDAEHRPPKPYRAPFEAGRSFPISQAFHGEFSHNQPHSEYAVDIAMPEGTRILAARAGVVMEVANDFFSGGIDEKYAEKANIIRILHEDGTMAIYGHLKLESAQVSPGVQVAEGQMIAESGNTGFSGGPHLHFAIQKNQNLRVISVPFEFVGKNGEGVAPVQGMFLSAY